MFIQNECDVEKQYHFAEFGCGAYAPFQRVCENYDNFKVSKFDIKKWDDETTEIDFNTKDFVVPKFDVCVFSGVLEYLNDVEFVIDRVLNNCDFILMSYASVPLIAEENDKAYLTEINKRAAANGWRNHYTNKEIVNLISKRGIISAIDLWNGRQSLFLVRNQCVDFI